MDLRKSIVDWLAEKVDTLGFAPVERFDGAPEKHHPSRICKDAKTVIVFGKAVPRGVLHSPDYHLYMLHRTYHSVYMYLDELGLMLSNWIEAHGDYLSVPVPTYAPLVFHDYEAWGVLSLKHAAVSAGLGAFGRNGLMHNPRYGTLLRLGAVVTSAGIPGDPVIAEDPCPEKCGACFKACPSGAFEENGAFNKRTCVSHTIKHAIYPIAFQTEAGVKNMERVINTAAYNYWLTCDECLKACPNNKTKRAGRQ